MMLDEDGDAQSKSGDSGCQMEYESLGLLSQGEGGHNLNVDKILTLFGGNSESVDYFVSLWTTVNDGTFGDGILNCDPRDERKRSNIKGWEPRVIFRPVDIIGAGVEGEEVDVWDGGGGRDDVKEEEGETVSSGHYAVKQTVLEDQDKNWRQDEDSTTVVGVLDGDGDTKSFPCGVHGCGQVLMSLSNYESHYHHCHNYVCDACRRVFVSSFLLDIHLQENHDSYFAILTHRIDMYRCLVESCEQKFRTPELRKDHLISVHKFPSSFSFHHPVKSNKSKQVEDSSRCVTGADASLSSSSLPHPTDMECEGDNGAGVSMGVVESTHPVVSSPNQRRINNSRQHQEISQNKRVPSSICFGRGSQRAFQPRRGRGGRGNKGCNPFQKTTKSKGDGDGGVSSSMVDSVDTAVDIETVDMKELHNALG